MNYVLGKTIIGLFSGVVFVLGYKTVASLPVLIESGRVWLTAVPFIVSFP